MHILPTLPTILENEILILPLKAHGNARLDSRVSKLKVYIPGKIYEISVIEDSHLRSKIKNPMRYIIIKDKSMPIN